MQSSALHLPRCIDAIYESNCVKCKNTSPHLSLTSWTSDIRGGGGSGDWHNTWRLSITSFTAGPESKEYLFLYIHQVCLLRAHPTHQMVEPFTFFSFFFFKITPNKLNSACLKQVKENKYHLHPSLLQRASAVQVDKIWRFKWQEGHISCPFSNVYSSFKKNMLFFYFSIAGRY